MSLTPTFSHPDAASFDAWSPYVQETPMRLTLAAFGVELDVTLGRQQDADEPEWVESRGSVTSSPVGFAPNADAPFEYDSPHRFDRGEGDEDT